MIIKRGNREPHCHFFIERQKEAGFTWAFKITSQKSNKFAKQKAHNWTSKNFDMAANSDSSDSQSEDETQAVPPVKRLGWALIYRYCNGGTHQTPPLVENVQHHSG